MRLFATKYVQFVATMAPSWSWKCAGYVVVGVIVLILIILLNFDYLPKRRLSEELEFTVKDEKSSWIAPSSPTPQTSTSSSREKVKKQCKTNHNFRFLRQHAELCLVEEIRGVFCPGHSYLGSYESHCIICATELKCKFCCIFNHSQSNVVHSL